MDLIQEGIVFPNYDVMYSFSTKNTTFCSGHFAVIDFTKILKEHIILFW